MTRVLLVFWWLLDLLTCSLNKIGKEKQELEQQLEVYMKAVKVIKSVVVAQEQKVQSHDYIHNDMKLFVIWKVLYGFDEIKTTVDIDRIIFKYAGLEFLFKLKKAIQKSANSRSWLSGVLLCCYKILFAVECIECESAVYIY